MIKFDFIKENEIPATLELVREVFLKFEAPDYSEEGVGEFLRYITTEKMTDRIRSNHFCVVASIQRLIIGVIEIRDLRHISLLFVHADYQRQGIGRNLWSRAFSTAQERDDSIRKFTVNSSPFAVPIYARLGFQNIGPEKTINGIRFFPMEFKVQ